MLKNSNLSIPIMVLHILNIPPDRLIAIIAFSYDLVKAINGFEHNFFSKFKLIYQKFMTYICVLVH